MASNQLNGESNNRILVERDGFVATVMLNRPEKLNALTKDMWEQIGLIFQELDKDEQLRCVILRGVGDEALGPGADISEFATERKDSEHGRHYGELMHKAMGALNKCRHPVVARIKGLCIGGSLELALVCDIRVAGDTARFGIPINRLGLVMALPEIAALIQVVGPSVALEILYEGRIFGASEAKEKRLINKVVPDDQVDIVIGEMVAKICGGAPLVNRWHKKFVRLLVDGARNNLPLTEEDVLEGYACFDTEDYQEGIRAFLAKKTPSFEGK